MSVNLLLFLKTDKTKDKIGVTEIIKNRSQPLLFADFVFNFVFIKRNFEKMCPFL